MKVLFAGLHAPDRPKSIGGTQSWIWTMARQFDDVAFWTPGRPLPTRSFDLGIFAHIGRTRPALDRCRRSVLISHGIIEAERPEPGADVTAFVSEEVRLHWGGTDEPIIRQPIDLGFWKPGTKHHNRLVRFAYRRGETKSEQAAKRLGLDYLRVANSTPAEARQIIQGSAVVHASGRAALEAMACDVPTVIYDHRQAYQRELFEPLNEARTSNYSGRGGWTPTVDEITDETHSALKQSGWRDYVAEHHDAKTIARELLWLIASNC